MKSREKFVRSKKSKLAARNYGWFRAQWKTSPTIFICYAARSRFLDI
jgi:hypothetical protein